AAFGRQCTLAREPPRRRVQAHSGARIRGVRAPHERHSGSWEFLAVLLAVSFQLVHFVPEHLLHFALGHEDGGHLHLALLRRLGGRRLARAPQERWAGARAVGALHVDCSADEPNLTADCPCRPPLKQGQTSMRGRPESLSGRKTEETVAPLLGWASAGRNVW